MTEDERQNDRLDHDLSFSLRRTRDWKNTREDIESKSGLMSGGVFSNLKFSTIMPSSEQRN